MRFFAAFKIWDLHRKKATKEGEALDCTPKGYDKQYAPFDILQVEQYAPFSIG